LRSFHFPCEVGEGLPLEMRQKNATGFALGRVLVAVGAASICLILALWVVQTGRRNRPAISPQAHGSRVVLPIEGLDCVMCSARLQRNLCQLRGVRHAEVSYQDKQASIDYDPRVVNPERFEKAVKEAGFKVARLPRVMN